MAAVFDHPYTCDAPVLSGGWKYGESREAQTSHLPIENEAECKNTARDASWDPVTSMLDQFEKDHPGAILRFQQGQAEIDERMVQQLIRRQEHQRIVFIQEAERTKYVRNLQARQLVKRALRLHIHQQAVIQYERYHLRSRGLVEDKHLLSDMREGMAVGAGGDAEKVLQAVKLEVLEETQQMHREKPTEQFTVGTDRQVQGREAMSSAAMVDNVSKESAADASNSATPERCIQNMEASATTLEVDVDKAERNFHEPRERKCKQAVGRVDFLSRQDNCSCESAICSRLTSRENDGVVLDHWRNCEGTSAPLWHPDIDSNSHQNQVVSEAEAYRPGPIPAKCSEHEVLRRATQFRALSRLWRTFKWSGLRQDESGPPVELEYSSSFSQKIAAEHIGEPRPIAQKTTSITETLPKGPCSSRAPATTRLCVEKEEEKESLTRTGVLHQDIRREGKVATHVLLPMSDGIPFTSWAVSPIHNQMKGSGRPVKTGGDDSCQAILDLANDGQLALFNTGTLIDNTSTKEGLNSTPKRPGDPQRLEPRAPVPITPGYHLFDAAETIQIAGGTFTSAGSVTNITYSVTLPSRSSYARLKPSMSWFRRFNFS